MTTYKQTIQSINSEVNADHVLAFIKTMYGTLDGLSIADFKREIKMFVNGGGANDAELWERISKAM